MIPQIAFVAAFVAVAQAGVLGIGLGGLDGGVSLGGLGLGSLGGGIGLGGVGLAKTQVVDLYAPPKYEYKYGVADPKTGDQKEQSEVRVGDVVKGQYSLAEPDGTIRVVKYTSDKVNGFNAVVERIGKAAHPQIVVQRAISVPLIQKAVAVPVVQKIGIAGIGLGGLGLGGGVGGLGLGGGVGGLGLGGGVGGLGLGGSLGGLGLGGGVRGLGLGGGLGGSGLGGLGKYYA